MNTESRGGACYRFAHELTAVSCDGDLSRASEGLRSHLADCAACGETLRSHAALFADLSALLQPAPLPARLRSRIVAGLDAPPPRLRTPQRLSWHAPLAAAAALAMCLSWYGSLFPSAGRAPRDNRVAVSPDDAAAISAALASVIWTDAHDASIESIASDLSELEGELQSRRETNDVLTWSREDDWDLPTSTDGSRTAPATPGGAPRFVDGRALPPA